MLDIPVNAEINREEFVMVGILNVGRKLIFIQLDVHKLFQVIKPYVKPIRLIFD